MNYKQLKPTHQHNCSKCVFVLATHDHNARKVHDWYVHPDGLSGGSIISRASSEGSDYWSMPTNMVVNDHYLVSAAGWGTKDERLAVSPQVLLARAVLALYEAKIRTDPSRLIGD